MYFLLLLFIYLMHAPLLEVIVHALYNVHKYIA